MLVTHFQRQIADGAAMREACVNQTFPVAAENGENSFDGIRGPLERRFNHRQPKQLHVMVKNRKQQVLFRAEEIIKASAANLGPSDNLLQIVQKKIR